MPDIGEGYSEEGFNRQRRNLVVGSIVLLFVQIADVELGKQGSLFGLTLTIGRPSAIQWFLIAAVCYWAIRFYQYRKGRAVRLQDEVREAMQSFLQRRAIKYLDHAPQTWAEPKVKRGQEHELVAFNFTLQKPKRQSVEAIFTPAWRITEGGEIKDTQSAGTPESRIIFRGPIFWIAWVLGYSKASFSTPAFTDYVLPYVFFAVSVTFAAYRIFR